MRLTYRLLWLENNALWAESLEDELNEIIEDDYGFMLEKSIAPKHEDTINYNAYDLILMDLNLQDDLSGDKLIQKIRNNKIYTDIIFYSADGIPAIKEKARALNLEGVYFSSRTKHLFLSKVKAIVETTIRKVQDLNNLRGLVMAETSELDKKMEDICLSFFIQNKTEKSDAVFEEILKGLEKDYLNKLEQSTQCDKKCTHKIRKQTSIEGMISNMSFDSSRKARAIKKIMEEKEFPFNDYINADYYESYLKDIIGTRNLLAHSYSKNNEEDTEVLISKKDGQEIVFDEKRIKEIRQRILLYEKMLDDLYDGLAVDR